MDITNYEQLERLSTQIRILNQILIDIRKNGILAPSLQRELADNELFEVIDTINSMLEQEIFDIITKKINEIKQQIKDIVK